MTLRPPRRHGIAVPLDHIPLAEQGPALRTLAERGFTDVCSSERGGIDGLAPLYLAATAAPSMRLNTSVLPIPTRGVALLAQTALSLACAAPGRVTLGLGASSDVVVRDWNAITYERPYQRTADTLRFLRAALAGERVTERYETFEVRGFRLETALPAPVPLLLAALRPRMLALAGREADGVVLGSCGPRNLPQMLAEVDRDDIEVHVRIFVLPGASWEAVRPTAIRIIGSYLTVSVYRKLHGWLGNEARLRETWKRWDDGDRRGAYDAIPDDLLDELVVWGAPEALRDGVEAFAAVGATTTIPMVVAPDQACLHESIKALAPMTADKSGQ